jgi:hypothetical protein
LVCPVVPRHIPAVLNLEQCCCETFKPHILGMSVLDFSAVFLSYFYCDFMGCDTVQSCRWLAIRAATTAFIFCPENGGSRLLQNVGSHVLDVRVMMSQSYWHWPHVVRMCF